MSELTRGCSRGWEGRSGFPWALPWPLRRWLWQEGAQRGVVTRETSVTLPERWRYQRRLQLRQLVRFSDAAFSSPTWKFWMSTEILELLSGLVAIGTAAPDVPRRQPQHKYVFTLRFVSNTRDRGEPGPAAPPLVQLTQPGQHWCRHTDTGFCPGTPKHRFGNSPRCSGTLSPPRPAPPCPAV